MRGTLRERLEARLVPTESGCLEWTGARNRDGYGTVWDGGKMRSTHRVSWELRNGEIPAGLCVLHKCDNRRCCDPAHLFLGTYADNNADMVQKGRARGGNDGATRVVDSDMAHFMFILAVEGRSQRDIGKRLGLHHSTVGRYLSGRRVAK